MEEIKEKTGREKVMEQVAKIKAEKELAHTETTVPAITDTNHREMIGFEDIQDADIMRVTYVRVVQPTSKKLDLADGKEAQPGTFIFDDTKQAVESLEICYLKGKMVDANFPKDGKDDWTRQLKLLVMTSDPKMVVIITLAATSFGNFGKFKAKLKEMKAGAGYEYKTLLSTHKEENDKGKYYVVDFEIGEKNSPEELKEYMTVFEAYKNVLEGQVQKSIQPIRPQRVLEVARVDDSENIPF